MAEIEIINSSALCKEAQFDACGSARPNFTLLRWQGEGSLVWNERHGPGIWTAHQVEIGVKILRLARQQNSDILLTAEYCCPLEVVDRLAADRDLWPSAGKLWCLGCGGEHYEDFAGRIAGWPKNEAVEVATAAVASWYDLRQFVCALVFVFTSAGRLYLVPQLKTIASRDPYFKGEGKELCLGKVIYCFGDRQPGQLYGLICADVMNREVRKAIDTKRATLIVHPQLNPDSTNPAMVLWRDDIFNQASGANCIYISANWSQQAIAEFSGNSPVRFAYSEICHKGELGQAVADCRGLTYAWQKDYKYHIWRWQGSEALQSIAVRKAVLSDNSVALSKVAALAVERL